MSNSVIYQDEVVTCQRTGCHNKVCAKFYRGVASKFRCPDCLALPVSLGPNIPAGHYSKCSLCTCYFKCMLDYNGSTPKCPLCRVVVKKSAQSKKHSVQPKKHSVQPIKHACSNCGTFDEVSFGPDPYALEIHDINIPVWECEACRHESRMDI